jgi:hypothetical protein
MFTAYEIHGNGQRSKVDIAGSDDVFTASRQLVEWLGDKWYAGQHDNTGPNGECIGYDCFTTDGRQFAIDKVKDVVL